MHVIQLYALLRLLGSVIETKTEKLLGNTKVGYLLLLFKIHNEYNSQISVCYQLLKDFNLSKFLLSKLKIKNKIKMYLKKTTYFVYCEQKND